MSVECRSGGSCLRQPYASQQDDTAGDRVLPRHSPRQSTSSDGIPSHQKPSPAGLAGRPHSTAYHRESPRLGPVTPVRSEGVGGEKEEGEGERSM